MAQTWTAEGYERNGRFVADLAGDVLSLLSPQPKESILDLGCGDGALSSRLIDAGAVVIGVDSSPELVRAAQQRGIDARYGEGEHLPFRSEFDAVFSNAALHWMTNQDAVLSGVHRALRPGGRFIAEMGGHGNVAAIRTALQAVLATYDIDAEGVSENFFPTPEEYGRLLEQHEFQVASIQLISRPTALPTGIQGWIETFRRSLLDRLNQSAQQAVIQQTAELLGPILCDRSGNWFADYVRLRFRAIST